jgi:hypothetical protein
MTSISDRPEQALEAARDVVKQLVTIDAALLTFGIAFVQNISKGSGPTGWTELSIVALLASLSFGVLTLFQIVAQTHKETGTINAGFLRFDLSISLLMFVAAVAFLSVYVIQAPVL